MSLKKRKWFGMSIFLIAVLAILSLLVLYSPISKTIAEEEGGPSEKTKSFFGEKGKGGPGKFEPEECKREQEQGSQNMSSGREEGEKLSAQIKETEDKLHNASSDEERASLQSELEVLMQKASELESQRGQQNQNQEQYQKGPSEECKAALVKMGKEKMGDFASVITNNILPKLAKVDEIVAKIEAKIPDLKAANVSAEDIASLESNIDIVKTSAATMKSFFDDMIQSLNSFLSSADTDVDTAFSKMESMHKGGKGDSASTGADNLVKAFTEIEKIIDKIKENGGNNGNQ